MIDLVGETDVMPAPSAHIMIHVTNRNPFVIRDRFNGVPVVFRPNETITISPTEANHFFGYPGTKEEMAIHMAKRFGWNSVEHVQRDPHGGYDAPMLFQTYAWSIEIAEEEMVLVPKSKLADDGLDVDTMPVEKGHPAAPADHDAGAKVGQRKGTPVRLGGHGRSRPRGRPARKRETPANDPSFVPMG